MNRKTESYKNMFSKNKRENIRNKIIWSKRKEVKLSLLNTSENVNSKS